MSRNLNYERKERLSELFREIMSDTMNCLDDPDLEFVTISRVEVDNSINRAQIYITSFETDSKKEEKILQALRGHTNIFLQDIASQARLRQLPELIFKIDGGLKASMEIEEILRSLDDGGDNGGGGSQSSEA